MARWLQRLLGQVAYTLTCRAKPFKECEDISTYCQVCSSRRFFAWHWHSRNFGRRILTVAGLGPLRTSYATRASQHCCIQPPLANLLEKPYWAPLCNSMQHCDKDPFSGHLSWHSQPLGLKFLELLAEDQVTQSAFQAARKSMGSSGLNQVESKFPLLHRPNWGAPQPVFYQQVFCLHRPVAWFELVTANLRIKQVTRNKGKGQDDRMIVLDWIKGIASVCVFVFFMLHDVAEWGLSSGDILNALLPMFPIQAPQTLHILLMWHALYILCKWSLCCSPMCWLCSGWAKSRGTGMAKP